MITDADVTKLKKTFSTKKEFSRLETKVDTLDAKFDGLQEEVGDLKVEVGELKDRFDSFEVKLDRIVAGLDEERLENAAGVAHLARHDRHIAALAAKAHCTLPD